VWNCLGRNGVAAFCHQVYLKENGHSRVQDAFVVPSESAWPSEAHDSNLKENNEHSPQRILLRLPDLMTRCKRSNCDSGFLTATVSSRCWATFEQLRGHRNVSRDFVVPSEAAWRERDWGVQHDLLKDSGQHHALSDRFSNHFLRICTHP
jgi:hypothetical protein